MSAGGEINSMGTILAAAKAANETARIAFEAGMKEGYRVGFKEGFAAAMVEANKAIDMAFAKKVAP